MSEEQEDLLYRFGRVLIESARVLDSTFPGCVLVLSGGQVEMLRNITLYLNRRSTFVSQYGIVRYTTPDDADWDSLSAIVADLEGKLMGNENVLWGYSDTYVENLGGTADGGTWFDFGTTVPSGEVWRIEYMSAANVNRDPAMVELYLNKSGVTWRLARELTPGVEQPVVWSGTISLAAGSRVGVTVTGCQVGDTISAGVWGYKVKVPG